MSLVKDLSLDLGDFRLEASRLEFLDDGITCLWGPSGSGKSTFMRVLLGLESQAKYQWFFGKENLSLLPPPERKLSFLFQGTNLFSHLTCEENILFPVLARKQKVNQKRLCELVERLSIAHLLKKKAKFLSGGEEQRVSLARCLILKSRFLFLDEPFSNLDDKTRRQSCLLVRDMVRDYKTPTLFITHNEGDRSLLCQKTLFINKGQVSSRT